MKNSLLIIVFLLSQSVLSAQNDTSLLKESSQKKYSCGFSFNSFFNSIRMLTHYNNTSDITPPFSKGLSYRIMPNKLGIQLSMVPIGKKNNFIINNNVTLFYQGYSSSNEFLQILAYLSASARYFYQKNCYTIYPTSLFDGIIVQDRITYDTPINQKSIKWDTELGMAFNLNFSQHFYLELSLGYGIFDINNSYTFGFDQGFALFLKF